jgi:hypothetical protein
MYGFAQVGAAAGDRVRRVQGIHAVGITLLYPYALEEKCSTTL